MEIRDKIIKDYPLTKQVVCSYECYEAKRRKYILFLDEKVQKSNIDAALLNKLQAATKDNFSKVKTLIVVGDTDDEFEKQELVYFNNADTFVVYFLKNTKDGRFFFNDDIFLYLSAGWRKIVRRICAILSQ